MLRDERERQPRAYDARPIRAADRRHPLVGPGRRDDRAGADRPRASRRRWRSRRRRTSRRRSRRRGRGRRVAWVVPGPRRPRRSPRAHRARPPPPPRPRPPARHRPRATSTSRSRATRVRPSLPAPRPQPAPPAEPADHVEIPLAERPRPQEPVVVEGRRDPARADVEPARTGRARTDGQACSLRADQPVADRDLARPHARPAIDLAFAPAALAGVAHQPARSVEAEAA